MPLESTPKPTPSFSPEKFQRKSGFRDYIIYVSLVVVLLGAVGGAIYYYTRPPAQKSELNSKLGQALDKAGLAEDAKLREATLKQPKLDGLLGAETTEPVTTTAQVPQPPAVATTAYAGGGPSRVLLSDDPQSPKPSPEFVAFVGTLKVSGVLPGDPAKAILNGRLFHVGDEIEVNLAVVFTAVERVKKTLTFRDKSGAELRVTY